MKYPCQAIATDMQKKGSSLWRVICIRGATVTTYYKCLLNLNSSQIYRVTDKFTCLTGLT